MIFTENAYEKLENACEECCCCTDWYPTREDIEGTSVLAEPERFLPFLVWLSKQEAKTEEQKEVKKKIFKALYETVEIVDDDIDIGEGGLL